MPHRTLDPRSDPYVKTSPNTNSKPVVRINPLLNMNRALLTLLIAVLIEGGLTSGCGTTSNVGGETPSTASHPSGVTVTEPGPAPSSNGQLPELAVRPAPSEEAALLAAVQVATARCMDALGFEYHHPDAAAFVAGVASRNAENGWMFPRGDARDSSHGRVAAQSEPDPNAEYLNSLDEAGKAAWSSALSGTESPTVLKTSIGDIGYPSTGCRAEGFGTIYGSDISASRVAQTLLGNLEVVAHAITLTREDIIAVQKRWSECMADAGYIYASFVQARYAFATISESDYALVAARDLECAQSSGLTATYRRGYDEEYAKLYEANRELIDNFLTLQSEAVRHIAG